MKICLFSEFYKIFGGTENVGGGLIASLANQRRMLGHLGIPFTEDVKDTWDILQVNIPWPNALARAQQAKKQGKKVVMWSHVTVEDLEKSARIFAVVPGLSGLLKRYLIHAYSIPDLIFSPTAYTRNLLIAYGVPPDKIVVQSNAVDVNTFFPDPGRRERYRREFSLTGLAIGNLALVFYRKGVDTFLRLAATFPRERFIWFGKVFSSLLVQRTSMATPPNVRFTGFVEDSVAALNALDIFVFPSHEENQGMAILEAAAVGLPILVRDIPVYEGWLHHDVNCLKARSDDEFQACLDRLLKDAALRHRLSTAALELAKRESIEVLAVRLQGHYAALLGTP
jgi:1,2-diacylglycerol-3-alpha-glucose alpha-1,2-glucosyltransferase